jgi:hypothetical protein
MHRAVRCALRGDDASLNSSRQLLPLHPLISGSPACVRTLYVLSNVSYMNRVMIDVLPTASSPRKTSLYFDRGMIGPCAEEGCTAAAEAGEPEGTLAIAEEGGHHASTARREEDAAEERWICDCKRCAGVCDDANARRDCERARAHRREERASGELPERRST